MLLPPQPDNHCFGCGGANPRGMMLTFEQDDDARKIRGNFRIAREYCGGPGFVHGGIVALLLDEAMAKVSRFGQVRAVTAELVVEYVKFVPVEEDIVIEAHEIEKEGRIHRRIAEIRNRQGELLARGRGRFMEINPARVPALKSGDGASREATSKS